MSMRSLPNLVGRQRECGVLDELVAGSRQGTSAVLVIRGEAGIGKSALMDYLATQGSGLALTRTRGVEADMELAYAGLHQLCAPFLAQIDALPEPQRDALRIAFGMAAGDPPDRFLVGLAVLSLFTRACAAHPLLVTVDDAQWLDQVSLQVLEFVAHRLLAEAIAMVFAVRDPQGRSVLTELTTLRITGLDPVAAGELLDGAVDGRLEPRVRDRLVAETHGNPLALLELYRGRSAAELDYGVDEPTAGNPDSVSTRVEQDFVDRLAVLPPPTRRLLLVVAAEPIGDTDLLARACELLDITPDAAPAKAAGLIEFGASVQFRHPLVRSAVYRSASATERRAVHRALAEVTDPVLDPDRRAWHAAQAADGPDEAVAAALSRAAERARQRGGVAAEAVLLQRAAELTPDPRPRGRRAVAAAETHFSAAAPERATELAALADLCPLDPLDRARLARVRARILFALSRSDEAAPLLLAAADQFTACASPLARETYLEAISAAVFAGRVHGPFGARAAAVAARESGAPPSNSAAADLLLDGVAAILTDGHRAGVPVLQRALEPFANEKLTSREATLRWLLLVPIALESFIHHAWDLNAWEILSTRAVRLARDVGAVGVLPPALNYASGVHLRRGDFAAGSRMIDEAEVIAAATGHVPHTFAALVHTAWIGDEATAAPMFQAARAGAAERGEAALVGVIGYVEGIMYNGLAKYDRALAAAGAAAEHDGFSFTAGALIEYIEAASRCGETDGARAALARLVELTSAADTGFALGTRARSQALVAADDVADDLYRRAIEGFAADRVVVDLARTHLLYGEWLRRSRRRALAREQLRTAYDMFEKMGATGFAERTRRELLATGERVRARAAGPTADLTPQEAQIAELAAGGMTTPQIGAELFLSPHTVEWHLRKVYAKLGIGSRRELRGVLAAT